MTGIENRISQYKNYLYGCALKLTRDHNLSEDLVQDTYLNALANQDKYTEGNLRAWLCSILLNCFRNHYRIRGRMILTEDISIYDNIRFINPNQFTALELKDVLKHIKTLDIEKQRILLLSAFGLTYDEIAEIEKIPVGTVKSRLSRTRDHIKNIY